MVSLERSMVRLLRELRDYHHVSGLRAEYEAEGARLDDMMRLKEMATSCGLSLTIKIGGCEAVRDLAEVRMVGAERVLAPMIESPFALRKFLGAIEQTYGSRADIEDEGVQFLINIETKLGFEHREEIARLAAGTAVRGVVMGRVDMAASLGLSRGDVESARLTDMAGEIAKTASRYALEFCLGGAITEETLPMIRGFAPGELARYETRKVVFEARAALDPAYAELGIRKATEFELMWLKARREIHARTASEGDARIALLEARLAKKH